MGRKNKKTKQSVAVSRVEFVDLLTNKLSPTGYVVNDPAVEVPWLEKEFDVWEFDWVWEHCRRYSLRAPSEFLEFLAKIALSYVHEKGNSASIKPYPLRSKSTIVIRRYTANDIGNKNIVGEIHGFILKPELLSLCYCKESDLPYMLPRKVNIFTDKRMLLDVELNVYLQHFDNGAVFLRADLPFYAIHLPESSIVKIEGIDFDKVEILGTVFELPEEIFKTDGKKE